MRRNYIAERLIKTAATAVFLASASRAIGETAVSPIVNLTFDAPLAAIRQVHFNTQFRQPDFTPGVRGRAWRSDGFSSWIGTPLNLSPESGFTVETWVALESYPSDLETPAENLKPASFMNQATAGSGFDLFIDTFGRWGFRVSTEAGNKQVVAANPFPLARWVHVACTYEPSTGVAGLYLDGKVQGQIMVGAGRVFRPHSGELRIGRSWQDAKLGIFRVNGLDAAFDDVRIFNRSLPPAQIARDATETVPPDASASLAVPASRFAGDLERPTYHAMPPANWTNEPHGLIWRGGQWHLFYQRTPNGPFKTEMHWGHMVSSDLVNWTFLPDALWPTLQTSAFGYDMKGIWSGDVINGPHNIAYAFYTSVNHTPDIFNPGISVALSADPDLRVWRKRGPIINADGLRDFRDPYVWEQDGEWRMIVGAAMPGRGGGVAYYRCANIDDIHCWKKQPRIAPFEQMDIGSDIWEMPVFEPIGRNKYVLVANPIGGAISKYGEKATRAVYWIGTWDGRKFSPDQLAPKFLDIIPGHLSPTVDRGPKGALVAIGIVDERRTQLAQKKAGWAHTFSLPRVWRLLPDGETLGQSPAPALTQLRDSARRLDGSVENLAGDRLVGHLGRSAELSVDFGEPGLVAPYGIILGACPDGTEITRLAYDPVRHLIILDKRKSSTAGTDEGPLVLTGAYDEAAFGPPRSFHIFIDHSVVDVFINDAAAFSFRIYPSRLDSTEFGVFGQRTAPVRYRRWAMRPSVFTSDVSYR